MTNNMHVFEEIEQYLKVQTAMQPGSPEMMAFLIIIPQGTILWWQGWAGVGKIQ
jgi:hypothetical protein